MRVPLSGSGRFPRRRRRVEIDEPLLPPVETPAEMDTADDLEEILDRRWAVND